MKIRNLFAIVATTLIAAVFFVTTRSKERNITELSVSSTNAPVVLATTSAEDFHGRAFVPGRVMSLHETNELAEAVGFRNESWRKPTPDAQPSTNPTETRAPISSTGNLGDMTERVTHALAAAAESASLPSTTAGTYSAGIDGQGLRFSPHRPGAGGSFAVEPDPVIEAVFRTSHIRRGGVELYDDDGAARSWIVIGNTAQALLDANLGLVEHLEMRSAGVELSWIVAKRLPGTGDLEIEAEVTGVTDAANSGFGHHFVDAAGTALVHVGNVTVVDAAGEQWQAQSQWENQRLTVIVPETVLASASYPLAIDPWIGQGFGPSERPDHSPATASSMNGDDWLIWQGDNFEGNIDDQIVAANISGTTAQLLTLLSIGLSPLPLFQAQALIPPHSITTRCLGAAATSGFWQAPPAKTRFAFTTTESADRCSRSRPSHSGSSVPLRIVGRRKHGEFFMAGSE